MLLVTDQIIVKHSENKKKTYLHKNQDSLVTVAASNLRQEAPVPDSREGGRPEHKERGAVCR